MKRILVFVCMVLFLGSFISAEYAAADRIVNNKDGTVTDTQTGLMWADHENGEGINWYNAKSYCEGYSGGGKFGWRLPKTHELVQLRKSGAYGSVIKKTADHVWALEMSGIEAANFDFRNGYESFINRVYTVGRALPVRSGK